MNEKWKEFLKAVEKKCPQTHIYTQPEECLIYSHGCYPREYKWLLQGDYPYLTRAVVSPADEAEISEIVKLANEYKVGIISSTTVRNSLRWWKWYRGRHHSLSGRNYD